jgi:DNA-binding NarL/FixJ family response regulator
MQQSLSPPPVTVAIVEDHPEFRDALCQALRSSHELQVLEVCKDLSAGLKLLEQVCPDVLLVDLGLPSGSGLTLIHEARRRWGKGCTSAVLTVTGNEEHLLTAIGAGAKGYLFKSDQPGNWLDAVRLLARGASPLHAHLARSFLQRLNQPPLADEVRPAVDVCPSTPAVLQYIAAGYTSAEAAAQLSLSADEVGRRIRQVYDQFFRSGPQLSGRELELLALLNKGLPFKQCAELMGGTESTTKTTATRAYQKLGATNLQAALYEARQANLIA